MSIYLLFLKTYVFGAWFNYVYLAVLTLLVITNILYFLVKRFKYCYKKSLNFIILLLFALTFGEFLTVKVTFNSISTCFLTFFSVVILQSGICYFIYPLKRGNKKLKATQNAEIKRDYGVTVKRAVEHIKMAEDSPQVFSGFVDVGYIKTLINNLKSNDLTEEDRLELDEFEVYLLNFVNRQPTSAERQNLSIRLNSLIKKLAKYA